MNYITTLLTNSGAEIISTNKQRFSKKHARARTHTHTEHIQTSIREKPTRAFGNDVIRRKGNLHLLAHTHTHTHTHRVRERLGGGRPILAAGPRIDPYAPVQTRARTHAHTDGRTDGRSGDRASG